MSLKPSLAIIGAGVSGAAICRRLSPSWDVTCFEKSRGVGGRLAYRRVDGVGVFDHGAQFFTCRHGSFKEALKPYLDGARVRPWSAPLVYMGPGGGIGAARPELRYFATPTNVFVKDWLAGGRLVLNTTIVKLERQASGWLLVDRDGSQHGPYDYLVATAPPVQSLQLFQDHGVWSGLAPMEACFCLLLGFEQELSLPGAAGFVKGRCLSWFANNGSKGRSGPLACLTLHGTGPWSQQFTEQRRQEMEAELAQEFFQLVGQEPLQASYQTSHFWRYARPVASHTEDFLLDEGLGLGLAGDVFAGGRVEGAFLSGDGLAERLLGS